MCNSKLAMAYIRIAFAEGNRKITLCEAFASG